MALLPGYVKRPALLLLAAAASCVHAQSVATLSAAGLFPDDPGVARSAQPSPTSPRPLGSAPIAFLSNGLPTPEAPGETAAPTPAKRLSMLIDPAQQPVKLTPALKFEMSLRKQLTLGEAGSAIAAAAWGNWRNIRPHYGTDVSAFGQRTAAAYIRQSSQSVFYVGLFSAAMRQDPRYYVMGPGRSFKRRFVYAASRVMITRTDAGRSAPNVSLWAGVVSSSLLTNAYYPDGDRDIPASMKSAGFSLMYRLVTQQLKEFHGGILHTLHLKKS